MHDSLHDSLVEYTTARPLSDGAGWAEQKMPDRIPTAIHEKDG